MQPGRMRTFWMTALLVAGLFLFRFVFDPAVHAVEAITPASTGG